MKKILLLSVTIGILCCLVSCTSKAEDIKKTYEENNFKIEDIEVSQYGFDSKDVTIAFKAVVEDETAATVISFSDSIAATEFYNRQRKAEDNGGCLKKRNTVIFGSKEAVELLNDN